MITPPDVIEELTTLTDVTEERMTTIDVEEIIMPLAVFEEITPREKVVCGTHGRFLFPLIFIYIFLKPVVAYGFFDV